MSLHVSSNRSSMRSNNPHTSLSSSSRHVASIGDRRRWERERWGIDSQSTVSTWTSSPPSTGSLVRSLARIASQAETAKDRDRSTRARVPYGSRRAERFTVPRCHARVRRDRQQQAPTQCTCGDLSNRSFEGAVGQSVVRAAYVLFFGVWRAITHGAKEIREMRDNAR